MPNLNPANSDCRCSNCRPVEPDFKKIRARVRALRYLAEALRKEAAQHERSADILEKELP